MNQTQEQLDGLLVRAGAVDWCRSRGIVLRGSHAVASEGQWRAAVGFASAAELELLMGHVRAAEIQQERDRARDEEFDRAREARERPLSADEQAAVDQDLREAGEIAARAELPATRRQLQELIDVQRQILAAMTKR